MRTSNIVRLVFAVPAAVAGVFLVAASAQQSGNASPAEEPVRHDAVAGATKGVIGSADDFSLLTGRAVDACSGCHVPHTQAVAPQPDDPQAAVLEYYKIAGQREVFVPDRFTPGPTSLICLSCHNGTVASSTVGSSHALLAGQRSGFEIPEGMAWRDHPIGIPYPRNRKDYRPVSSILAEGKVTLPEGRIECISCHDPHNEAGVPGMLVMSNRRSALCLACHIK